MISQTSTRDSQPSSSGVERMIGFLLGKYLASLEGLRVGSMDGLGWLGMMISMKRIVRGNLLGMLSIYDWEDADNSLTAQFAHLGSTVFDKPELDIPEQQLALAYTIDYDLDNFAAAVGFARQSVDSLTQEPGKLISSWRIELMIEIEVVVGDSSLEAGVYEPVQRILDQVRTVKVSSRYVISARVVLMNSKLVAQMEEVWQISSALLPEVTVALADLSTSVSSAVDLAVQVS